jgi:hypothetical protein
MVTLYKYTIKLAELHCFLSIRLGGHLSQYAERRLALAAPNLGAHTGQLVATAGRPVLVTSLLNGSR